MYRFLFIVPALLIARSALAEPQGPTLNLPPEEPRSIPRSPTLKLPREAEIEVPLEGKEQLAQGATAIGGYGELTLNSPSNAPTVVDMRRLVLYIGHNFTDKLRFYGEVEVEHAVTSSDDQGEFEVEQAFLDYLPHRAFNLRAGVILIPMGIINIYHEPPMFHGVDRPETDTLIIPSTWREPGLGFFGMWKWFRYQAYVVNGFNANGFNASSGLREGHQEAQLAFGHDWGFVGRVDFLPVLWADIGASYYYAHADQGQKQFGGNVPVNIFEADAKVKVRGFDARAEFASVWIGGADRVNTALEAAAMADGSEFEGPVARWLLGGYVEASYNILQEAKLRSGVQLMPFVRYEHTDTQFRLPSGATRALGNRHDTVTAGVTFRPIAEIALKLDYQHVWTDSDVHADANIDRWNAGIGFMF